MQRSFPDELDRVVVVGTSCSGKTTFSRHLSKLLQARHIELDALHWKENWEARTPAELRRLVEEAISHERWIADGNYGTVREVIWPRATAVAWLNYPFWLVFSRALWRTVRRVSTREDLYSGNRESFRKAFLSRDSILVWVISSHWRRTPTEKVRLPGDGEGAIRPGARSSPTTRRTEVWLRCAEIPTAEARDGRTVVG